MKKRIFSSVLMILVGLSPMLLLGAFLTYGIWSTNLPPNWGKPYPEGTQIIQQTDTHQGIFRRKGIAVGVVQIPVPYIQAFGDKLLNEEFRSGHLMGEAWELLCTVETARDILDSENTLYNFDDGAIAFIEDPFSEWEAAVYDLETGLFCYIEYDE